MSQSSSPSLLKLHWSFKEDFSGYNWGAEGHVQLHRVHQTWTFCSSSVGPWSWIWEWFRRLSEKLASWPMGWRDWEEKLTSTSKMWHLAWNETIDESFSVIWGWTSLTHHADVSFWHAGCVIQTSEMPGSVVGSAATPPALPPYLCIKSLVRLRLDPKVQSSCDLSWYADLR